MISDERLSDALRTILSMDGGFSVGFAGMLEIGQLENLNYWVRSRDWIEASGDWKETLLWQKDDLPIEEAITHFLRIRKERELGYDIEVDLDPGLGHIGPRG